jgi:hypothetical protein
VGEVLRTSHRVKADSAAEILEARGSVSPCPLSKETTLRLLVSIRVGIPGGDDSHLTFRSPSHGPRFRPLVKDVLNVV